MAYSMTPAATTTLPNLPRQRVRGRGTYTVHRVGPGRALVGGRLAEDVTMGIVYVGGLARLAIRLSGGSWYLSDAPDQYARVG